MATDDDKGKERDEAERDEAERDEAERDEAERDDASTEGSQEGSIDDPDGATTQGPRNRAERRQLAKQVKRGQATPDGEVKEKDRNKVVVRPKVPPRTVTGKSTANTDEVPPWAQRLGDWLSARRTTVIAATAVLTLTGAGAAYALQRRAEAQGAQAYRVVEAAELSLAQVRSAEDPPDPPNAPPRRVRTFSDHTARARAALAAAEQAMQGSSDLVAISIAKLQRGIALYDLGRYAEAKSALEALVGADLAGLEGRALETLGYCLESLNDLPGALRRFEELGRLDGEGWRDLSAYHQARVLRRQNQNDRAKDLLRRLIERVERARPDDTSTTASRSIVEQAKALLHEIAPEDPLGRRESAPTDPDAIMRMLRRQLGDNVQIRRPGQGETP